MLSQDSDGHVTPPEFRGRQWTSRHPLALGAVVALCVTTALVVGVGWAVGHGSPVSAGQQTSLAASWQGSQGVATIATEADARALRGQGWTLPTLSSAGYRVTNMVRGDVAGQPAVVITLRNHSEQVAVIEQRGDVNPDNPVDGTTGLPVSAEGLSEPALGGARLWVVRSDPWRAVMARQDVVYTVVSDASPATLSRTLTLVAAEERGRVTLPGSEPNGFAETVLHGLRRIVG